MVLTRDDCDIVDGKWQKNTRRLQEFFNKHGIKDCFRYRFDFVDDNISRIKSSPHVSIYEIKPFFHKHDARHGRNAKILKNSNLNPITNTDTISSISTISANDCTSSSFLEMGNLYNWYFDYQGRRRSIRLNKNKKRSRSRMNECDEDFELNRMIKKLKRY